MIAARTRAKILAPVSAAATAVALIAGSTVAQAAPLSGWFVIQNKTTGGCVDAPDHQKPRSGAAVGQFRCDNTTNDNQRWVFRPRGTVTVNGSTYNNYVIANEKGGLCLDAVGDAPRPGARVSVQRCTGDRSFHRQEWYVADRTKKTGREGVWIVNKDTKMCLDVAGWNSRAAEPLTLFGCLDTPGDDHYWRISKTVRD